MFDVKAQTLRDQMVINKAMNPNRTISAKSWLIFAITWTLWLAALYYISINYQTLLNHTIIADWTLLDLIKGVAVILLVQLNFLFVWSIIVTARINRMRRHESMKQTAQRTVAHCNPPRNTQPTAKSKNKQQHHA